MSVMLIYSISKRNTETVVQNKGSGKNINKNYY